MKYFRRVLIANRGEIAVRIIRTLRDMGIQSVAVYSDADAQSLHVAMADYAIRLPGVTSAETYLQIPLLIQAINESQADAVHPGYGFLSENADFAEQIYRQTKAKFIGPSPQAIRSMGDKLTAKKVMQEQHIPVVPGSDGPIQSLQEVESLASKIGFPVILKASAGGGGRGIRIVYQKEELKEAFEACTREAQAYFGNPSVFCERYVANPRHIEFQVLCDEHGKGVHLFERDCSIQRRAQKLFEEAPSSYLNEEQRVKFGAIAVKAAAAVGYAGVGTVEFICESPERVYFMEMNTRIQVEHPVTELITGVDLIKEQIKVAMGQPLTLTQDSLKIHGWSMEARINAEDPLKGFAPSPGYVERLRLPSGPHVRVDSHLYQGYEIPAYYDSMVAKVIVWGQTREEARQRMLRSLKEVQISGVTTTVRFHEALLNHPQFSSGDFSTTFIEEKKQELQLRMTHGTPTEEGLAALLTSSALMVHAGTQVAASEPSKESFWLQQARQEGLR
jgi:acetyl-CoA carboxylase biotin carboxylase subunit